MAQKKYYVFRRKPRKNYYFQVRDPDTGLRLPAISLETANHKEAELRALDKYTEIMGLLIIGIATPIRCSIPAGEAAVRLIEAACVA